VLILNAVSSLLVFIYLRYNNQSAPQAQNITATTHAEHKLSMAHLPSLESGLPFLNISDHKCHNFITAQKIMETN